MYRHHEFNQNENSYSIHVIIQKYPQKSPEQFEKLITKLHQFKKKEKKNINKSPRKIPHQWVKTDSRMSAGNPTDH